jgi:hypothetical protein
MHQRATVAITLVPRNAHHVHYRASLPASTMAQQIRPSARPVVLVVRRSLPAREPCPPYRLRFSRTVHSVECHRLFIQASRAKHDGSRRDVGCCGILGLVIGLKEQDILVGRRDPFNNYMGNVRLALASAVGNIPKSCSTIASIHEGEATVSARRERTHLAGPFMCRAQHPPRLEPIQKRTK